MKISARLDNGAGRHTVAVCTNGQEQPLAIPPKPTGQGSAVNGGELLFLALATCYCNDLYREAAKRGIEIDRVQVEVSGDFGGPGQPAHGIFYSASVDAKASEEEILELMCDTDAVSEVQNTIRKGVPVLLAECKAHEVTPQGQP